MDRKLIDNVEFNWEPRKSLDNVKLPGEPDRVVEKRRAFSNKVALKLIRLFGVAVILAFLWTMVKTGCVGLYNFERGERNTADGIHKAAQDYFDSQR